MQPTNSTLQYSETALVQRGTADINAAVKIPLSKLEARKAQEMYRFPGATPERDRVRRTVSNTPRAERTSDAVRQQQIDSATANAFSKFARKTERQLTKDEVEARTEWLMRAAGVLSAKRAEKMQEQTKGVLSGTIRLLTGSENAASMFSPRPTERQLVQQESEIGGTLFGATPENHHRQFFNLDEKTWVWYEESTDAKGIKDSTTTRYEVHQNGILKVQDNAPYYFIEGQEFLNFFTAGEMYYQKVAREIYHFDPTTGKSLAV